MRKADILKDVFKPREGFGVTGASLKRITEKVVELYGSKRVQINLPYSNFNCKGSAKRIAREVYGLTPFTDKQIEIDEATTLFYGDTHVRRGNYLPFQGECDVFFVGDVKTIDNVVVIDLIEGPNWRTYL